MEEVVNVLTIEGVSVIGLLLIVCACLLWYIKRLLNDNKEKDDAIIGFVEKYYVIATKLDESLKRVEGFLNK